MPRSKRPRNRRVQATYENWRTEPIELPNTGKNLHRGQCLINFDNYPEPVFVYPDAFRPGDSRIRFWHQMREDKNVFHHLVRTQQLEPIKDQLIDPCRNLVFGGEMIARSWTCTGRKPFVGRWGNRGRICAHSVQGMELPLGGEGEEAPGRCGHADRTRRIDRPVAQRAGRARSRSSKRRTWLRQEGPRTNGGRISGRAATWSSTPGRMPRTPAGGWPATTTCSATCSPPVAMGASRSCSMAGC